MTSPAQPMAVRPGAPDVAAALLDDIEQHRGVPAVDETEHDRLRADPSSAGWEPRLAVRDDTPVGYAGVRVEPDGSTVAELAVVAGDEGVAALAALLDDVGAQGHVRAWLRGAEPVHLDVASRSGWVPDVRLQVLGLVAAIDGPGAGPSVLLPDPASAPPDGVRVRTFTDPDADAVERLLAAAHPESTDGWGEGGFARRRAADWFRAEDLLLLDEADVLLGVHWMKRRGPGLGEVHNLAVHPNAQGRGFGGLLLDAGLAHLAAIGCSEVLLWVAADNAPARRLYASRGFGHRWDDVALVPAQAPGRSSSPPR